MNSSSNRYIHWCLQREWLNCWNVCRVCLYCVSSSHYVRLWVRTTTCKFKIVFILCSKNVAKRKARNVKIEGYISGSVCLLVCLWAKLLKKLLINFHEIFGIGKPWHKKFTGYLNWTRISTYATNLSSFLASADRSQPLVGRSAPYCEDMWRRYFCLTSFFPLSIRRYSPTKLCDGAQMAIFWRVFAYCIFSEPRAPRLRPAT